MVKDFLRGSTLGKVPRQGQALWFHSAANPTATNEVCQCSQPNSMQNRFPKSSRCVPSLRSFKAHVRSGSITCRILQISSLFVLALLRLWAPHHGRFGSFCVRRAPSMGDPSGPQKQTSSVFSPCNFQSHQVLEETGRLMFFTSKIASY